MLGGGEDGHLLDLIGYRRVMDALCCIERLLGVGDVLEELREIGVRNRDVLLLGLGVRLGGIQLGLCGRYGCVGGIKGDLLLLDGRLCRIDCRVGGIEVRFRRIKLGLGIRDALLLGGDISLGGIDGTLGIGDVLLRGIDVCLCGIRCVLLLLDGCGGAGGCLLLGCEIGLGCVECALGVLETVDIRGQLLLVLVDGDGVRVPTGAGPAGDLCGVALRLKPGHGALGAGCHSHNGEFGIDDVHVMADGAATAVLPVAVVCNPMVDCDAVLCIEIIGILADKTGDSIKGLRCLVEKALLLLDPLPTRIDSVIPCQVFGKIILTGMIEHGVAVVGICDRTGDELVGDMELGQADRLAVVVDGLHPLDRIEHIVKRRGVLGVADFGLSGIFGVQDDVGCIFGTHGTEEADGSLLELRVGGIEFRLGLVDLLLRGGHGGVGGILCGLGVRKLYIGGCLGGLSVLDSLLRGVQLGDGIGVRLLGRIEVGVRGIECGLGVVHAGRGIDRGLLLRREGCLGII